MTNTVCIRVCVYANCIYVIYSVLLITINNSFTTGLKYDTSVLIWSHFRLESNYHYQLRLLPQ